MSDRLPTEDFVGRIAELAVFEQAIAGARDGVPSVLLVGGDAGIGKTTIVAEAALRADVPLYRGRSTHIGGEVIPLAALADLLRQLRRSKPDLVIDLAELAPIQGALFAAVLELVTQLAVEDAVIVAFEDLHWADAVTWDLFEFLARNLIDERVVLVATFRANEIGANPSQRQRLAELIRIPATHRIHLQGLAREEVAARISTLIGGPAPSALVDQIVSRGQGNPFFTSELVTAHMAGETIPIVLSDLISAEIAGLNESARLVLGMVAALGRETRHEFLAATVDMTDKEVEAAVRIAIDAKLLVVDRNSDAYQFRHPLLGEVVYADLLPPQRSRLHRRIAETLQAQSAGTPARADLAGELAFHFDRAGDKKAAFFALLAAADAAETFAPGAAYGHLQRAFELWDSVGEPASVSRGDRLWQFAELATHAVSNARAAELARAALEFGPPRLGAAWGHERIGRYLWTSGQLAESQVEFEQAAKLLSAEENAEAPLVFAGLGQAELMFGHYEQAEGWCAKVFDLVATPADNRASWVMARRVLGVVRSNQAAHDDAVELCREAVAASVGAQPLAFATVYLCVALVDAGDNQGAINVALDAVAAGQLSGLDRAFGGYFDSLAAEGLTRLGRWPEADLVLERHPLDNTLPVGLLRVARAKAMLAARRGQTDEAASQLANAQALPLDGWHQSILQATTADVHLALGNWADAADAADVGWESTATTSALWAARFAMLSVAATVEQTRDELARRESVDVASVTARLRQRIGVARALVEQHRAGHQRDSAANLAQAEASLTLLGEWDADAWAEAATGWTELGDIWATAAARLREAEAAASIGAADRAATSLREAHSIALGLGAAPLLAEIDAVSRRTRISIEAPTRVALDETSSQRLGLTPREAEVLGLIAAGRTNRQIGEELYVSDKTASVHVSNILRKLGVTSRVDAAAVAQRLGVT